MTRGNIDRRLMVTGLATAAMAAPLAAGRLGIVAPVHAQIVRDRWSSLADLSAEAQRLGLSVPRMGLAPSLAGEDFVELQISIVDFMDSVAASAPDAPGATSADVDRLVERAADLLRSLLDEERVSRDIAEGPQATPIQRPPLSEVADGYRQLFATCEIRTDKRSTVQWYLTRITDPARRKNYEAVTERTCVPWYVVAIIHGMECSFDMSSHLHNGDPLRAKTVRVPAGRPVPWLPPSDWVSSATDALRYDKLDEQADWDLANTLYRWESYNGWRSRLLYSINTPYLWSFSNHYTKGKFVRDNVWDGNAVSNQCGAAVMLKALIEAGTIAPIS